MLWATLVMLILKIYREPPKFEQVAKQPAPATPSRPIRAATAAAKPAPAPATVPDESARTPSRPTPKRVGDPRNEALAAVEAWARAWSGQNVDAYLSHYAPDFAPAHGATRGAWERLRRGRISGPKFVSVTIEAPQVALEGDAAARVTFMQIYRSDRYFDRTDKTLELVKVRGKWLIRRESDTPAVPVTASAPAPAPVPGSVSAPAPVPVTASTRMPASGPAPAPQSVSGPAPARSAAGAQVEEMLLQVDVNKQNLNDSVLVLRTPDGRFLVSAEDLDHWRLRKPEVAPIEHAGAAYYPLDALPGTTYRFDRARQTLDITASPAAFTGTTAVVRNGRTEASAVLPSVGGFLNYDVSRTHTDLQGTNWNGLFEAGMFSRYGVLTSSMLAPDLQQSSSWVRLDTTYTIDFPDRHATLRLGDSVTDPGAWGLAVRFGGIQYGTNFNTDPQFNRYPLASSIGQAALPSTVDVFVNNALISRQSVPPGPFTIDNIPTVTGSGEIRMVVRDLLGREQVITQPFYGTTALLRHGLSDYSFELGSVRDNYGIVSNDYGAAISAATYRYGFTDVFTGEARGEYSASNGVVGVSGTYLYDDLGTFNSRAAFSHGDAGSGQLLGLGFQRTTQTLSVGASAETMSADFRQAGMLPGELPMRDQVMANASYRLGNLGSVSIAQVSQSYRDRPDIRVSTLSYSMPLDRYAQLSLNAIRTSGATDSTSLFATLAIPLGDSVSASVSGERTHDSTTGITDDSLTAEVQKSLPAGPGYGYRLQAHNSDLYGSFSGQTNYGTYTLEAARYKDSGTQTRVSAAGGVGLVGGHAFLSRRIDDSFALVRVADYPNVRVLADNQVVARTDSKGYAVLPRLRPYERNPIGIDQADLPLDAKVDALKLYAVPYYRSGVLVDFPVERVRAGTFHVVLDDGRPLPSGALARLEGRGGEFPVALDGEAYLEGFEAQNRIVITWKGQRCTLDVPYPESTEPLPDLGKFVCKGVKP